MIKKILIHFTLILSWHFVDAQVDMGTIEVNENYSATLMFADDIDFVAIGNNPQLDDGTFEHYELFKKENVLVINSYSEEVPETSITIRLIDGEMFYGILKHGRGKLMYNFKETGIKIQAKAAEEKLKAKVLKEKEEKLDRLMTQAQEYFSYGIEENSIEFVIKNIKNDSENTYMKITINNGSASNYNIDGILFKYVEGRRKGLKKTEAKTEERIYPEFQKGPEIANAYSSTDIGVILPLFTVGNKGWFQIQLREKNGTRNPLIEIKSSEIIKIKIFE